MEAETNTRFFLGANSANGFYSLYGDFADIRGGTYLRLIKGGPGCGKSSFMRAIGSAAENAGLEVQYIQCSGDPKSLDGIYIPEKALAYMDATAPHVMDALLPAAGDTYLDLGAFYRTGELRDKLSKLSEMNIRYKSIYKYVYSLLSAAGKVSVSEIPGLITDADLSLARRRAAGVAEREFGRPQRQRKGHETHCFISAISSEGWIRLNGTIDSLCKRVYALDDDFGLADTYLQTLLNAAGAKGIDSVVCHDPLHPEKLEALILPELSLGFAANRDHYAPLDSLSRNIRLDAIPEKRRVQALRPRIRTAKKLKSELLNEAIVNLRSAKALHDEIEAVYNPHVDFDGLYELCGRHIKAILAK